MWEVTLVGGLDDIDYMYTLQQEIYNTFDKSVIVALSSKQNVFCSIATNNKENIQAIKILIIETILKIAKIEYFSENLNINGDDKDMNKFIIMSLAHIGTQEECGYILSQIKFSKVIDIRSFIRFKLCKLQILWDSTIRYVTKKVLSVNKHLIYLEYLKFISQNCDTKYDAICLVESNNSLQIYNKNKKLLSTMSKSDEIGVIVNLIMFAPKKLIINNFRSLSQKVQNLITYIFEDRVSFII